MAIAEKAVREADYAQHTALPPYHLFEKFGEKFLYDLSSSRFFRVDDATYDLLRLCLTQPIEEAKADLVQQGTYPLEQIEEIADEIATLTQHGLFDVPGFSLSEEEMERQLEQRYASPWTRLELALAETCNLACTYCYCGVCRDTERKGLMSETVAKRAIDWLFKTSGERQDLGLTLFGGEPLLNREVFQFVMEYSDKLAKKHGKKIRYTMTTNGTLLDDMSIGYIKKHNFGLMVSLDGPPEIHDRQCPFHDGTGSYDAASKGIKRLMKRRKQVTVRCTMTNDRPRMKELIDFYENFGFTRILLGRAHNIISPSSVDCDPETLRDFERQEEEELLPWILASIDRGERPKHFPYGQFLYDCAHASHSNGKMSAFRCGACRGTSTVGAEGTLYPCHRFVGMSGFEIGCGESGPELGRIKRFWRDYDAAVDATCARCWARQLCNRPCPWEIANSDGTFHAPETWHCGTTRRFFERAAWVHLRIQRDYPEMYAELTRSTGEEG